MKKSIFIIIAILFAFNLSAQIYYNNNTVGSNSSALGANNTSNGTNSFVSGYNSQATGIYSSAIGHTSLATGMHSLALGSFSTSEAPSSVAIGPYAVATSNATGSIVMGNLVESHMPFGFIIGSAPSSSYKFINNISNSLMIGFNSNRPTLFISGSGGQEHTGSIGIGDVTDPQAKLHIKADDGYTTEVLVQWSNNNMANLWLGTTDYGMKASYNKLEFKTPTGGKYIFNDGNVGIGTITPSEKLEVSGNIKASGTGYMITSKVQAFDIKGLSLYGTSSSGIIVMNDGKVGIGTNTPTERFEVNGNIKQTAGLSIYSSTIKAPDANGLKLYDNSNTGIIVKNNGNVGIGNQLPSEKLEVAGNIKQSANCRTLTQEIRALDAYGLKLCNSAGKGIIVANSGSEIWALDDNGLKLYNSSGNGIVISNNGNVGIGINPGLDKLDVLGSVKATSMYTSTGTLIVGKENYEGTDVTEITDPQFEVRSDAQDDRKSANFVDENGRRIFLVPKLSNGGYNTISDSIDAGIFFSDALDPESTGNLYAGFVIGPQTIPNDYTPRGIKIDKDGNVGIGKAVPTVMLDVNGDVKIGGTLTADNFNIDQLTLTTFVVTEKLEAGMIEVKNINKWKDCVFENNYELMSLKETESFINQFKHLPGIPSEKEVLENGINVGEMNALLLQKIEELTLYVIELEKKINENK